MQCRVNVCVKTLRTKPMSENLSNENSREKPKAVPGLLRSVLPAVALGAVFAAGIAAVQAIAAIYSGSYIAWEIIFFVTAFWTVAAAAAVVALGALLLPALIAIKRPARTAILPGIVLAAGFVIHALVVRPTVFGKDALGEGVLLNRTFMCLFGIFLSALCVLSATGQKKVGSGLYFYSAFSMLFSAGLAYFVRKDDAAFALVLSPLGLVAIGAVVLDRIRSAKAAAAFVLVSAAVFAAALFIIAAAVGERPLAPIDKNFRPDPGKAAMLAGKPNVIIAILDTVRADHTSLCGYEHPTTPNLEKLAADCRFFPHGESVDSWTLPAHASMFTGKYPREHGAHAQPFRGVKGIDAFQSCGTPLAPSRVTLAALLSAKGYNTAAIVANYIFLCRQYGLDQGFSYYYDLPRWHVFVEGKSPVYRYGMEAVDRILGQNGKLLQTYWSARSITSDAEAWIEQNKGAPFFLFLNYMDAHCPYSAPPPFDHVDGPDIPYDMRLRLHPWMALFAKYLRSGGGPTPELLRSAVNQYDGEIAYADHWLGRLIERLKAEGLYDDALIIVTSDHGEFLGEHQLLSHGVGVYEGGLRIPILVKYPGGKHAGEVVEHRVSIVDIFATVLEVLDFKIPECSAVPLGAPARELLYAEDFENASNVDRFGDRYRGDRTAAFHGDWKYISSTAAPGELYDLARDAAEEINLEKAEGETAAAMERYVESWQAATPFFDGTKEITRRLSQGDIEKLRSLGYLGGGT